MDPLIRPIPSPQSPILGNCRGQLIVPALLLIPSFVLFIYLIFETAKLSREKMRQQFALDSAAFIEMTVYSDFLNRTAYINGTFPNKVFKEAFEGFTVRGRGSRPSSNMYEIMYENGAFPRTEQSGDLDSQKVWQIRFNEQRRPGVNNNPPNMGTAILINGDQGCQDYWIGEEVASQIYQVYSKIYSLLGQVEGAQQAVFERLTSDHNFFKKSYRLNTGTDDPEAGEEGAGMIPDIRPKVNTAETRYWFTRIEGGDPRCMSQGPPDTQSVFQLETVDKSDLVSIGEWNGASNYPGAPIVQHWKAPSNYFRVDVNRLFGGGTFTQQAQGPFVHSTIAVSGGQVWPDPTPKYQTRLYP